MFDAILKQMADNCLVENAKMSKYTTFKTGGRAEFLIDVNSQEQLADIITLCSLNNVNFRILGNGSNVLVSDSGIKGVVIRIGKKMSNIKVEGNVITAQAGATLAAIAKKALKHSLTGFEFAAGIPGTAGGALVMNAGAYGGEMKDIVESVEYIDIFGTKHIVSNEELEFGYRKSMLSGSKNAVCTVTYRLEKGDANEISSKMEELATRRREKQPLEYPSAGSVFKRPEGYFAGELIEKADLKGYRIGGAQVSEKHAGFIINTGKATSSDVLELIEYIKKVIFEKNKVKLETEVQIWED